jgi:tRNA-splicing ligase RtcB
VILMSDLKQIAPYLFEIPKTGSMRVPGRVYATRELMESQKADEAIQQVRNVAHLPGIVGHALAMPDFHWGYGFPIGGVAAFEPEEGIISPGGVGYDINCGVRIVRTSLTRAEVQPKIHDLVRELFRTIPAGVGSEGAIRAPRGEDAAALVTDGAKWAIAQGYGVPEDLDHIEDGGLYPGADPRAASDRAFSRGMSQVGTLGSGNHFLEIQAVDEIYRTDVAEQFGLRIGTICFAIHSGSRGFGYQVCEDFLKIMMKASRDYGIELPDRQLCCAPLKSPEARRYLAAMACAANFAWVNRQVMTALARRAMARTLGMSEESLGARLIYDVCHNIAKFEDHGGRRLCVHRKGATRAFGPGHPVLPAAYRDLGQPTFIPGDMGRASFLLIGKAGSMRETFGSTCHGAGRAHSRTEMKRRTQGRNLFKEMEQERGVFVMAHGRDSIAEEMPEAYKDASLVVDVMEQAGITDKVARLRPIGCIKG